MDINSAVGRKAGLSDEKLLAIPGSDLGVFTEVERLVIELADAMAAAPANVSDDLYARLRQQFSCARPFANANCASISSPRAARPF